MERKKIVPRTLTSQVAEALEASISSGEWKIGQKIPSESSLIRMYGVSRNTLREAIHYLGMIGVLDVRPGDGTYVCNRTVFDAAMNARLAKETTATVLEARLLIEPAIAGLAAKRRTEKEAQTLKELDRQLTQYYLAHDPEYIEKEAEFHRYLVELCHNSLVIDLYSGILQRYLNWLQQNFQVLEQSSVFRASHDELCRAIEEQNENAARTCMKQLLESTTAALQK